MKTLSLLLVMAVLLTGCGASPAQVQIRDVEWKTATYGSVAYANGIVKNVGMSDISYLEISVKLIQDDVTIATGWTNMTQLKMGESRKFSILIYDYPEGEFEYEFITSTKPMGVPM